MGTKLDDSVNILQLKDTLYPSDLDWDAAPYRVQVVADNSGAWCGNGLRFRTCDAARAYAIDLAMRWTAVKSWRVISGEDAAPIVHEEYSL